MKILLTGGGTGGHIYPALAFIKYVKSVDPTSEFMYIGAKRGLENKILPQTDIPFQTLEIQGFKRSLSVDNLKTLQLFFRSMRQAKKILRDFQPDVVIGTGGYVSGAVVFQASRMHIPTIIHEQNSVPGITNKFLARYVDKIGIAFSDAGQYFPLAKTELVGNPRAQEMQGIVRSEVLSQYDLKPGVKTVLIFGGSQGALKINQAVVNALPTLAKKDYQVLYASGERYYQQIEEEIGMSKDAFVNISIQPYIHNMAEVMANCDLLIGRAGATSIAELTALGLPSILIPSPYVTNDHQTKNAKSLEKIGASKVIADADLTGERLVRAIDSIMNDDALLQSMSKASKSQGIVDASQRLYKLVLEVTEK